MSQAAERSSTPRGVWLTVAALVAFIALAVGAFVHTMTTPRVLTNSELKINGAFIFDNPRSFKSFSLLDDNGDAFTPENLKGKWSLIFFGFTYCPDVCPTTMAMLNRLHGKLQEGRFGDDTQVVMVSVDPARDTVEKLHDYVKFFNPAFTGVTGEFLDIHRFATQLSIPFSKVPGGGENYTVEHSGNVAMINPRGHYVGFFKPPFELSKLAITYQSIRMTHE